MFQLAQTVWPRVGGDQANRSRLRIAGPHTAPHWQKTALPVLDETPEHMKKTRNGVIVMPDETLRVCHAGMLIAVTLDGTILWQVDLSNLAREDDYWISSLPTALQTGETLLWQPDKLLLIDRLGTVRTQSYLLPSGNEWANADDSGFSPNLTHNGFLILSAITGEVYFFTDGGWIALSKQQLARLTFDGKELWARENSSSRLFWLGRAASGGQRWLHFRSPARRLSLL